MEQIPLCSGVGKHLQEQHFHFQRKKIYYLSPLSEERNFTHRILFAEGKVCGFGRTGGWGEGGSPETQMGPLVKRNSYTRRFCRQQWRCISTTGLRTVVGLLFTNGIRTPCPWSQADLDSKFDSIIYNLGFFALLFIFVPPNI